MCHHHLAGPSAARVASNTTLHQSRWTLGRLHLVADIAGNFAKRVWLILMAKYTVLVIYVKILFDVVLLGPSVQLLNI